MGMTAHYVRVTELELQEILAGGAKKVDAILESRRMVRVGVAEQGNEVESLCQRYAKSGHWHCIEEKADECGLSEEELVAESKRKGFHLWFDLDKSYNELHLLLTGQEFPLDLPKTNKLLSLAVIAEDNIRGTEHYGYGPARYVKPTRVKEVAAAFAKTGYHYLVEKNEFDPEDWGLEHDDMEPEFESFKKFYLRAAEAGDAILLIFE